MIGEKLSPVLELIDDECWNFKCTHSDIPPNFTTNGFAAVVSIFMFAMTDKMFENMQVKGMNQEEAELEAQQLGQELRQLVLKHTGIDTFDLFSDTQTQF